MMGTENKRRLFIKQLFSLLAFSAGSVLSYKENRGLRIGKSGQIKIGLSEAQAKAVGARVKKIACEEHANKQDIENFDKRLKAMDEADINMQVVSFSQGGAANVSPSEEVSTVRGVNDTFAGIKEKYPERFAFYTTLPLRDPDKSVDELERAVKQLGLKGPLIYAGYEGSYLDDHKFWGIYEMAEKLGVPVYVHPGSILPDMNGPYNSPYPVVSGAMWGFAAATGLHAVRLIVSGVFDKYPGLKIMLGHLGEGIPYWLWRMDNMYVKYQAILDKDAPGNNLKKKPSQYFKENFYVTTSGMFWETPLQLCITALGADRILFGCDYPPESDLVFSSKWIDSVSMSDSDREKICHLNAEKLLRI
jgi:predicted TIM-barrel fold metal-dependent hydrolase